jgi:chemotaxis protein MotB
MARKRKSSPAPAGDGWLVTFGDLVTLLLTFFVLLLSMSSMDRSVLTRITFFADDVGFLTNRSAGRIPQRVKLVIEALDKPWEVLEKQKRIKDLLFPDDELPPEISRSTLEQNLQVLARPEGVALVLTDALLFPPGGSQLTETARRLLAPVVEVLLFMPAPVNVAGYTDDVGGDGEANYVLSGERALSGCRRSASPWRATARPGPSPTTPPRRAGPRTAGSKSCSRRRPGSAPTSSSRGRDAIKEAPWPTNNSKPPRAARRAASSSGSSSPWSSWPFWAARGSFSASRSWA